MAVSTPNKRGRGKALAQLSSKFRGLDKPVIGRIEDGQLMFDLRCLENADELIEALHHAGAKA